MKRKWKLLIADGAIVLANILFFLLFDYSFSPLRFGRFIVTFFFLVASVAVHCMAYAKIPDDTAKLADQMNSIIQSNEARFDTYMAELKKIKNANPEFAEVINHFMYQINSFSRKETALEKLINLNDDKSKAFLMARNNDVQRFLIKNLKKFVKRLIVYNAKTRKNRSGRIEEDVSIIEIFNQNDELVDLYDKLLDEVSRMGDDFDIQDPGLQSVIENLQSLRGGNEADSEDDEEEISLFVSSGTH